MSWLDSIDTLDRLAAEYVLGTLSGPARRRFESLLDASHATAVRARALVAQWEHRLHPLVEPVQPLEPPARLWRNIEVALGWSPAEAPRQRPVAKPAGAVKDRISGLRAWFAEALSPVPLGTLAAGLMLGLTLPHLLAPQSSPADLADEHDTQLPESYVGVLATTEGKTGLIVSSRRKGRILDVKRVTAVELPAQRQLYLWIIDAAGNAEAVTAIPAGEFVSLALPGTSDDTFARARELAVSIEPLNNLKPTAPGSAFVYRGLCGKLWRLQTKR